jgi:hypothetical protein
MSRLECAQQSFHIDKRILLRFQSWKNNKLFIINSSFSFLPGLAIIQKLFQHNFLNERSQLTLTSSVTYGSQQRNKGEKKTLIPQIYYRTKKLQTPSTRKYWTRAKLGPCKPGSSEPINVLSAKAIEVLSSK